MSEPTLQEILPADIASNRKYCNAGTQARVQTDQKTVQAYAESMQDGIEFPPIDVFSGGESGQCILADGFHRYTAHISLRPNEPIKCFVHDGDVDDARIFACGANAQHGLRRTNEDKRKATKILLKEPKCQEWSNVKIADYVKVSEALVRKLRAEFELTSIKTKSTKRVGKDGRVTETKNIGRSYAFDEEPEPETNYRTNADGKTVNVRGFDFEAHRKCEDCIKWNPDNGYCMRDEKRQPSWSPACADFDSRKNYQIPEELIQVETLSTRPKHVAKNPHGEHTAYSGKIREVQTVSEEFATVRLRNQSGTRRGLPSRFTKGNHNHNPRGLTMLKYTILEDNKKRLSDSGVTGFRQHQNRNAGRLCCRRRKLITFR